MFRVVFFGNSPKLETTLMSFNRQMVKQTVAYIYYPHHGTLRRSEKEWTV